MPNASVEMVNSSIHKQCTLFIIGEESSFDEYFGMKENIFDNTSCNLKINGLRQIISNFSITDENRDTNKLIREFLDNSM